MYIRLALRWDYEVMVGRAGKLLDLPDDEKADTWASFSLHALNYETPPSYHDSHGSATFLIAL
jgi:hypothetical protein